jgi:DnaK suppressor protein
VDTEIARQRLEQTLAELDRSARTLENEHAGESSELSTVDQHQADSGTEMFDADRQEALLEVVHRQRGEVQAALARIAAGTYGRCVDCGAELPDERLEARPEAARCVSCQQRREVGR